MDGPYAAFVIPAFAITAVVFAGMVVLSLEHARRWKARYQDLTGETDRAAPR